MSKKSKNINVVIEFDNEEYSEEETTFLYQRFINILAEAKGMKDVPQYLGKALAKGISEEFKQREQTRTSQNRFTQ